MVVTVTVELPYPVDKVLVVVEREIGGVVVDELEVVEGEEDSVVGKPEDESGLGDSEDEDEDGDGYEVLVRVVELAAMVAVFGNWAKIVLGHAKKAVIMIASEYLIMDIGLSS
jgi:hypothetical protein